MKRDMDLARAILFAVETLDYTGSPQDLTVEWDWTAKALEYHVMLLDEAGLIVAQKPLALCWLHVTSAPSFAT